MTNRPALPSRAASTAAPDPPKSPALLTAFEQLKSEGYIEGTIGSGSYVSKVLPEQLLNVTTARAELHTFRNGTRRTQRNLSEYARRLRWFPPLELRRRRAFPPNVPALDLFPTTLWAQIAARRFRMATATLLLGCDPLGYGERQEVGGRTLATINHLKGTAPDLPQPAISGPPTS